LWLKKNRPKTFRFALVEGVCFVMPMMSVGSESGNDGDEDDDDDDDDIIE
jgi:hypothetical protein